MSNLPPSHELARWDTASKPYSGLAGSPWLARRISSIDRTYNASGVSATQRWINGHRLRGNSSGPV